MKAALLAGSTVALAPAAAQAATTVGSTLQRQPVAFCAQTCTAVQTARPEGDGTVAVPGDGVIVRWRVRSFNTSPGARLRVLDPTPLMPTSTASSAPADVVGGVNTFPTRLPVKAGQRLGVTGHELGILAALDGVPGFDAEFVLGDPPDGRPFRTQGGGSGAEILLNADVEADVDADGFGDETQDDCPTVANPTQADVDGDGKGDACDAVDDRPCAERGPRGPLSKLVGGLSRPLGCTLEGLGL
jgi:hypothetical protein